MKTRGAIFFLTFVFLISFVSAASFGIGSTSKSSRIIVGDTINNYASGGNSTGGVNASTTNCSGTNKFSAYNNATGVFTCSADQTGGGTGNSSWNESYADTLYSNIQWNYNQTTPAIAYTDETNATIYDWVIATFLRITDFIIPKSDNKFIYNDSTYYHLNETKLNTSIQIKINEIDNSTYLSTFNQTYDDYKTNVSLNYTKIIFDAYNATWSLNPAGGGGDNASWSEATANGLYSVIAWGYNMTTAVYNLWNTVWLSTFNQTYEDNISLVNARVTSVNATNYSQLTFNAWNSTWDNRGLIIDYSNSTIARIGTCGAGQVTMNSTINGVQCVALPAGTGGNPFDQVLNITNNVTFYNSTITTNLTIGNNIWLGVLNLWTWITGTQNNITSINSTANTLNLVGNMTTPAISYSDTNFYNKTTSDERYLHGDFVNYLWNESSSDVAAYFIMNSTLPQLPTKKIYEVDGVTDGQILMSWINSNTNITFMQGGLMNYHLHLQKTSGATALQVYMEMYIRNAAGTETLTDTSESSIVLPLGTEQEIEIHSVMNDTIFNVSDKLVIKLKASGGGGVDNLQIYTENTTGVRVELPIPSTSITGATGPAGPQGLNGTIYNQDLNTTANVTFYNATITTNLTIGNNLWLGVLNLWNWITGTQNNITSINNTVASYATNVSLNYSKLVFDAWNATWSENPIGVGGGDNASWNESFAGSLYSNITWGYNMTKEAINILQPNITSVNVTGSFNHTAATFNAWNILWLSTVNVTTDSNMSLVNARALSINNTNNLQQILNSTGIYAMNATAESNDSTINKRALSINITANIQQLLNNTANFFSFLGIGTGSTNYLLTIANSVTSLNVSGFLYVNSSSVGIGEDIPEASLHVVGNITLTKSINQTQVGTTRYFSNNCREIANATGVYWIC